MQQRFAFYATVILGLLLEQSYAQAPTVTGVSPTSGSVGTVVTVTGNNFTGATSVRFNGITASFSGVTATSIIATVPGGATTGPISVVTPGGTGVSATTFVVNPVPVISSFTPTRGYEGTVVTLTGTNFGGLTSVRFNGLNAPGFIVNGAGNSVTVRVPAGATSGLISVTSPSGTQSSAANFAACGPAPVRAGFTFLGGNQTSAFYLSTGTATWTGAQANCQAAGGNLAKIPDAATSALLVTATGGIKYWIGLNDVAVEGQFRWVSDNSLATYFNWCVNNPNNYTGIDPNGEDYVSIDCANGQWNDADNRNVPTVNPLPPYILELPVCATVSTSTIPITEAIDVSVHPNPAHTTATVAVPALTGATITTLTLTDALGRTARTETVALPATGLLYEMKVSGLAPGLYALRVEAGTLRTVRRLVVE
ncbi:IPT/TIG domain-containing protein [Hymenobacter rubidus]|uniref:IPT/TIG domain-containing protein n=1 Tax=Hymenobacter rubidus TaxID=1441626 RepID=UPI00191E5F70|nr:IPT/TIG domain-containing protein [Hymenobacter rubidus]